MRLPRLLLPLCLLPPLLLQGCGGGGGGGSGGGGNAQPVARASAAPDAAFPGDRITLDGSDSSDPDGSVTAWAWEQVAGPEVALSGAGSATAGFTAPEVTRTTDLAFVLTVTDNRGASASARATVTVSPPDPGASRFSLGGAVLASPHQVVDSDTNDPASAAIDNSSIDNAQRVANPVTIGGYVNRPGTGPEGRSFTAGDVEDYFAVDLLAGQTITLLVADSNTADADLYLYNERGEIVDFSIETGELEQVSVPEDGRYAVNVSAFDGGTNYILAIGTTASADLRPERHPIVPGEAIVSYEADAPTARLQALSTEDLAWRMGMRQRGGGPGRPRLLATLAQGEAGERFGPAAGRESLIRDPALRERWETLIPIKRLRRQPGVRNASPNYRLRPLFTPDDPGYRYQWHYPLIDLPAAWDVTTGSSEVVVAVVDTGILPDHPDLRGQLVPGYDFIRSASAAGDGDGIDPDPTDTGAGRDSEAAVFHGSHVAGTVAAAGDNGTGIAGAAYGARVMPLRALSQSGGTSYDIAQAVRYAAGLANDSGRVPERPADIINLSVGGEGFSQITQDLYREVREAGVIVVAAAGNDGSTQPSYPAAYDGVLSVSAVDAQRRITTYSNRGPTIDLAAPGGDNGSDVGGDGYPDGVLSTAATGSGADPEYAYTFVSGTSMATPHISGVLALMKSVNPALGPGAVDDLLERGELTVDLGDPGRDDSYGHGLIDARRAVNAALAHGGDGVRTESRLSASSNNFNFGNLRTRLDLVLASSGEPPAQVLSISSSEPWLSASAEDIDINGLGRYSLNVDRESLADGIYSAVLTVRSTANTLEVRAHMAVGDAAASDLGTLYILLYDPESDTVVEQVVARAEQGRYDYRFDDIPRGNYELYAGTDADNDLTICDAGEACGAWLTTDQPATITLDRDREGIDFPADYQVAIPDRLDASEGEGRTPNLTRTP